MAATAPTANAAATPSSDVHDTDSILDAAGYPLTPGVSALGYKDGFAFSGYLQGQYEFHQDSADQLDPSGASLNRDKFVRIDWQEPECNDYIIGNLAMDGGRFDKAAESYKRAVSAAKWSTAAVMPARSSKLRVPYSKRPGTESACPGLGRT